MYPLLHSELAKHRVGSLLAEAESGWARSSVGSLPGEPGGKVRQRLGAGLIRLGLRVLGDHAWA
jgi:hypothetical protein